MTGRYAFRTGGLTNESWRGGGPGAKSVDEYPMAKMFKSAGYATGQAGKWRQVGELPGNWGFDEFLTDNTAGGWYWQTHYNKNGKDLDLPEGTYGPDVIQNFTVDFIRRHKDQPFFFYYAMHLVHKPTVRTPDSSPGANTVDQFYDDNIKYMDKQVGELVDELEKDGLRKNTLIIFSGDNGTAAGYPSPVHGRMLNGWKGSMLEGGSRVPLIASWPAVTPAGKVIDDIISFADPYVTFAELVGAKLPDNVKPDGHSFAPELRGETTTPRQWAYVQLGQRWFVREPGYKLNESGDLFDMSDAPFVEKLIPPQSDTQQSKTARQRLTAALAQLNPAAGKTDRAGRAVAFTNNATGPWKKGDALPAARAPQVAGKALRISAEIDATGADGVIVSQGAAGQGYAVYIKGGKLAFAVRENKTLTTIVSKDPLDKGHYVIDATLDADGAMDLVVDQEPVANGNAGAPIPSQPKAPFVVGPPGSRVLDDGPAIAFKGSISNVTVKEE
jgi:arylsulfatase A